MTELADIETTSECSEETTKKKHPKPKNETGDQGSHETTPEHTARLRNNSMAPARYTGSKMCTENSDQDIPSGTADVSSSSHKKKACPQPQQHNLSQV